MTKYFMTFAVKMFLMKHMSVSTFHYPRCVFVCGGNTFSFNAAA